MSTLTPEQLAALAPQLNALAQAIADILAATPALPTQPTVPVTPASVRPFDLTVQSASGKTLVTNADSGAIKDLATIQFANGRTTTIVGVQLGETGFMTLTTSEPAADSVSGLAALSGTKATVRDRNVASTVPPVVVPPVVTQPTTPTTPTAGDIPLAGLNMSGLGNNPYVKNAVAGTHFREPEQKYFDKYQPMGVKLFRLPIAPERCVNTNKGDLAPAYIAMIRAALDKAAAIGARMIIDPHSYMRIYTEVAADAQNPYGYDDKTYNGTRMLWIPVGAPGCKLDKAGYADMLNKLATTFTDHPGCYGLGIANEPFSSGGDPFNVVAQYIADAPDYVAAISSGSTKIKILVGGGEYCTALNWPSVSNQLFSLADPHDQIIYEAHQYLDGGMYGGGAWSNRNEVIPVENGVNMVKPFVESLKANGKRGIIGEMGYPAGNQSAANATSKLLAYCTANGVPVLQWCAGPGWSPDDVNAVDDDNLTLKDNINAIKPYFGKTTSAYGTAGA